MCSLTGRHLSGTPSVFIRNTNHNAMRLRIIALTISTAALALSCGSKSGYSWKDDLQHRVELDFCKSRSDVKEYITKYIPDVTDNQIDSWTRQGCLEALTLNGETWYFRNAGPNLFRIDKSCREIKEAADGAETDKAYLIGKKDVANAAKAVRKRMKANANVNVNAIDDNAVTYEAGGYLSGDKYLGKPHKMRVRYTLTVKPDAVPDGETVRCWLPYPRTDVPRQKNVRFIEAGWTSRPSDSSDPLYFRTELANAEELTFSGNRSAHSSLYMEAKASAGWPVVFYEEFEYDSCAEWIPLGITDDDTETGIGPSGKKGAAPKEYTKERDSHILFSPRILELRDSLCKGIDKPILKAKAFYDWVDANFPWASAREYSTIKNIPEYVLHNRHGDCGQVSLLFITLCRSAGIPARFQSGFMMHPGNDGLHDWAEIWIDGYGWIPVDQSFGGETYMGALDAYRLVINNDFGRKFIPEKKYPRSETVDFQRGEVEWDGGNLYFDQWNYEMKIR